MQEGTHVEVTCLGRWRSQATEVAIAGSKGQTRRVFGIKPESKVHVCE